MRWKALAEIHKIALESNPPMKRNGRKEENGKTGRKGRLTMAEKNNGDNNKGDAHVTPLLGNSPAWRTAEPSKLAGDEGELVPSYPNPVT